MASIATPPSNGNAPAAVLTLEEIRARARLDCESLLAPLSARRDQLEAELAQIANEEDEIKETLIALGVKSSALKRRGTSKPAGNGGSHKVGQATCDEVLAYFANQGDERTAFDVISDLGISASAVRAAIAQLRADEKLRITGTKRDENYNSGKPPNTYGVMPNE